MEELKQAFYTPQEADDILKVNVETIRRRIKDKTLKANKMGNRYRISQEDLQAFIEITKEG